YGTNVDVHLTSPGFSQRRTLALDATGTLQHLNVAVLPRTLTTATIVTDLSGRFSAGLNDGDWRISFDNDLSTLAGVQIAEGGTAAVRSQGQGIVGDLSLDASNVTNATLGLTSPRPTALGGHVEGHVELPALASSLDLNQVTGSARLNLVNS